MIGTFVEGPAGRHWLRLTAAADPPGLYFLVFKQWEHHGAGQVPDGALELPKIRNWHMLSPVQLSELTKTLVTTYNAVVFAIENLELHKKVIQLWNADLKQIGYTAPGTGALDVVPGLPNSRTAGIQRGSGVVRGRMACHLRGLPSVHQLWDICCVATGRPAVFESDAAAVIPPDGVLFTSTDHDFEGLVRHRDWERDSCGTLQGLIYVWPPPAGVRRLGAAFSAYKPHPELMERAEMLAVAGWSSSPEVDWRTSPAPALGSPPAPKGGWPVIGGVVVAKAEAVAMSPSERAQALRSLSTHVRQLLPSQPVCPPTTAAWLTLHGFPPLAGKALEKAWTNNDCPRQNRALFLQALAGGMKPGSSEARKYWAYGPTGVLATGVALVANSIMFADPGKLQRWVDDGGARNRSTSTDLQPSGRVGDKRKDTGHYANNLLAGQKKRRN